MFNTAQTYKNKFEERLLADFREKFPGIAPDIKLEFSNDKNGVMAWADCVLVAAPAIVEGVKRFVFSFYLSRLYGNCGTAVLSAVDVLTRFQNKGIGTWLMGWQIKMMSEMNYTIALATTNQVQNHMERVLLKSGWTLMDSMAFTNRRTRNPIKFWFLRLPEPSKPQPVAAPVPPAVEPLSGEWLFLDNPVRTAFQPAASS